MKQDVSAVRIIQKSLFEIAKEFISSHSAKEAAIGPDILMGCVNACVSTIAMCLHIMQFKGEQLDKAITAVSNDIKRQHRMFDASQEQT